MNRTMTAHGTSGYSAYEGFKSFAQGGALSIEDIVKGLSQVPADFRPFAAPEARVAAPLAELLYENREPVAARSTVSDHIPTFLEALCAGDRGVAFNMLRAEARSGGDTEAFLTQVACALDDAYRARLEGVPVHPAIARITQPIATPVLERLVTAIASAIDSSYSVSITGAKLALVRALATLGT